LDNNSRMGKEGFVFPTSFAQQRMWFLHQWEPDSPLYNIPCAFKLTGRLDLAALEHSLNELVRRHEALRTSFSVVDGQPVQVITPSLAVTLSVVDLFSKTEADRQFEALRLANEQARRPFDLTQAPLFRASVLRLAEEEHVLLLTLHHIVSDGWSMGVLFRELSAVYDAFSTGKPSALPQLPIQYPDFSVWQRQWLQGEVLENQLSYWKKQLEGAPGVLDLPTDRPRPAVQSYRGARQSFELSKGLTEQLKALSRKEGVTLFMTLLAAFQGLLYRYTEQEDIVVGSPIANRNRTEIEGLIGFFVNTLVLRTDLSGNPTFRELLHRMRNTALEAYEHQDLPFEKLVEELQPERSLSHSPFFQVMFVLQNAPSTAVTFEGLSASPVRIDAETAKFDLTLFMSETEEGLRGSLQYGTDLFDAATIARMSGHLQTLLEGIVENPHQRITHLPILTQAEEHQLLVEWNDTERDYPKDKCIHQLFEEQVERTPGATAAVFEDQRLTYRELNVRANQLAHYLRKLGVGTETLVGISVERSLEMVVGLLGILKAGGAYVPLDPQYPKDRLEFMLEDTQAPILLTQERVLEGGIEDRRSKPVLSVERLDPRIRVICLDRDWEQIARERDDNPTRKTEAENVTYVIYTSGSTGKPKGVMVHQLGLFNVIQTQIRAFGVQPNSRVLQFASLSFDASISEIMMALCAGATLCLGSREDLLPGEPLVQFLFERAITHCTLPPSAIGALPSHPLPWLSTVTVAGEICPAELVARWASGRRFFNLYGPTEASIWTAGVEWAEIGHAPPIGKPIANAKIYILDANLHLVPVGVPGELYIGGIGLARGYLRRPDLTAEKFIPDPFSTEPGWRLYRSGDRARYRMDGNVDFIGRTDHQVKIRGFRIEPAEIEAVLAEHLMVREVAVVATADNHDGNQLVAFMVLNEKLEGVASQLRNFLSEKLPNYMIPSDFSVLEALPLTPNGKVDRLALTLRDHSNRDRETAYLPPQTEIECCIAGIWQELLRKDKIGLDANFFDLGGHSLLLARLHSKLCQDLKKDLSIVDLFKYPTIGSFSNFLIRSDAPQVSFQKANERAQRHKERRNRQKQLKKGQA
jgi:surfactin family lipopeptide synthetase A